MSIFFSDTFNCAVLVKLVKLTQHKGNSQLGRTALQKLVYFSKSVGVPVSYRHVIYHYGPYCDEIPGDIDYLIADGLIQDTSANPKCSSYIATEESAQLLKKYEAELRPFDLNLQALTSSIDVGNSTYLELLSTLHFGYNELKAKSGDLPTKEQIVKRFVEIKEGKFADEEVQKGVNTLVELKMIELPSPVHA